MALTDNQERDFKKYFVEKGEIGFSPTRNKEIIEQTIKKTDKIMAKKRKEYKEKIEERSDAVATYLKAVDAGKEANVDRYFGKKFLAYLRGQQIIERLQPTSLIQKSKVIHLDDITN